jgi:hypothetical protein
VPWSQPDFGAPGTSLCENYNEQGEPLSSGLVRKLADQGSSVAAVSRHEEEMGADSRLSDALMNQSRQQVMTAMRLYDNGKAGLYSKVIEQFETTSSGLRFIEQLEKAGFESRIVDQDELKALGL